MVISPCELLGSGVWGSLLRGVGVVSRFWLLGSAFLCCSGFGWGYFGVALVDLRVFRVWMV